MTILLIFFLVIWSAATAAYVSVGFQVALAIFDIGLSVIWAGLTIWIIWLLYRDRN